MVFIKKFCIFNEDVMQHDDIINYGSIVQEDMPEYRNILTRSGVIPLILRNFLQMSLYI